MKSLFEVLEQKKKEMRQASANYERAADEMRRLTHEVEAMQTTVKLLSDSTDGKQPADSVLSQPQMVRAVLGEHAAEMHMSQILEEIKKKFNKTLDPNVMAAVVFRYAKRGSLFYKVPDKPNTWGLLEWRAENPALPLGEMRAQLQQ